MYVCLIISGKQQQEIHIFTPTWYTCVCVFIKIYIRILLKIMYCV